MTKNSFVAEVTFKFKRYFPVVKIVKNIFRCQFHATLLTVFIAQYTESNIVTFNLPGVHIQAKCWWNIFMAVASNENSDVINQKY